MIKNISDYSFGSFISILILFLTIPFFTRYLTPEDFGVLAIYTTFGSITTNLLTIGIFAATSRYYYKEINNPIYFSRLNYTNFLFIIIMFTIGGLIVWSLADKIAFYLFNNKIGGEIILWSYLGGCLSNIYSYLNSLLVTQQRSKIYALIQVSHSVLSVGLAIIFIMLFSLTFYSRIYGGVITYFILMIVLFYKQKKYFLPQWSLKALIRSLKFSYPSVPGTVISLVHQGFDKVMLTNMRGLFTLGNYQMALKIGEINKILMNTIVQAWTPFFMHKAELKTEESNLEIVNRYQEIVMAFNYVCILIAFFAEEIIILLTTEPFYPSMYIVPIIVMYVLFNYSIGTIAKPQVVFAEKLICILYTSIYSVIINIILNIILIPIYGGIGAALATGVASVIGSLILLYYAQKYHNLPMNFFKLFGQYILFIIFLIPIYFLMYSELSMVTKILSKILLLIIYFWLTLKLRFIYFYRIKDIIVKINPGLYFK